MCLCNSVVSAAILCLFVVVYGFNIETHHYTVHNQANSMFGFSVAFHKKRGQNGRVLVGAPEAESRFIQYSVRGPSGAVYSCMIDNDNSCEEVPFDINGNVMIAKKQIDDKRGRWLGATLSSPMVEYDGRVVACAPRYIWFTKNLTRRDPVGSCFVSDKDLEKFEEYSPCRTGNWGYHRQGSCQAGFSAAINSEGDRVFVGAPGSYYWQGQMYSVDANAKFNYTPSWVGSASFGAKGSVIQQSLETRAAVYTSKESSEKDDDSYMGYSTVVGDFQGGGIEGVAVGMPRGGGLRGKVLFFTWDLTNYKNISSDQIGSYFGYALAAADVDGDKRLDLIVGAPMHTEPNTKGSYDEGRIYVFYQGEDFKRSIINGKNSKARFGHALASLGDLNQDGYSDFAVGAPYDGPEGRGAVYIFCGSQNGVIEKYTQVIYGKNVESNLPLLTFGFSLAGGIDLDGNEYPDMAVGAYLSDAAFFFRSKAVVMVNSTLQFAGQSKEIDIKQKTCQLPNGEMVTCTSFEFCISYHGKGIPRRLDFTLYYNLDTKSPHRPRMLFRDRGSSSFNESISINIDQSTQCTKKFVYIKNEIRDKLTPLEAEVGYALREDNSGYYDLTRNPRSNLMPVLDLILPPSRKDAIIVQKNCGSDSVCIPNLSLNITTNVEKYLLGSRTNLEFDVTVNNIGEDSFETTFEMKYPDGVFYKRAEAKDNTFGILCSNLPNRTVLCDIGNPLPNMKIAKFSIQFQPNDKEGMGNTYDFDLYVNSTNPESNLTMGDNHKHVVIDIFINSSLELTGRSYPHDIFYNQSLYDLKRDIVKESDIGPQVVHVYHLRNNGPVTVQEAEMLLLWPYATLADEDLLYLLDEPHTSGNVKCELAHANFKNVLTEFHMKNKTIWEVLNIDTSEHSQATASGFTIEQGPAVTGIVGGTQSHGRGHTGLEEEIGKNTGDASLIHVQRHNTSSQGATTTQSSGSFGEHWNQGAQWSGSGQQFSTRWESTKGGSSQSGGGGTSSQQVSSSQIYTRPNLPDSGTATSGKMGGAGESVYTKSEWRTVMENDRPVVKWTNITTLKDSSGKIINTYYSSDADSTNVRGFEQSGGTSGDTGKQFVSKTESSYQSGAQGSSSSRGGNSYQTNYQHGGSSSGNVQENREHTYQLGGGSREGGVTQSSDQEIKQHESSYFNQDRQRQLELERRQYEDQQRKREEEERKYREEEERRHREEAERRNREEEERIYREQEERRRQDIEIRRQEEERRHKALEADIERRRVEEEHRRRLEEERRFYEYGYSRGSSSRSGQATTEEGENYEDDYDLEEPNANQGQGHIVSTYNKSYTTSNRDPVQGLPGQTYGSVGEAAVGNGFRVHTIDLGQHSGADISGSARGQDGLSWQSGERKTSGGSSSWQQERHWSNVGQVPASPQNTVERDNVPTDRPDPNARFRGKRQINPPLGNIFQCNSTKCHYIRCVVGTLTKDKEVIIALRSRLNVRAIKTLQATNQPIQVSSMMVTRISKLKYIGTPKDEQLLIKEVATVIPADESELPPKMVPLWVIILAAFAGVLILLLLILLLYKVGFFKRNRPSSAPERQPLNRNGYHHGDEAL